MTVLPEPFFPLMSGYLMSFSFFTAWHKNYFIEFLLDIDILI